jgi:LppX_LprAFG lipoprotein
MRLTLALLALTLAALPLACGGDDLSPKAAVAEAATKTADAGSARVSFNGEMTGVPGGPLEIRGEGEFEGQRGRITFDMSDFAAASGGLFGGEMEMVMDGLVIYMKFPSELAAQLPGGKPWLKMDLKEAGKELGIDFEDLMQFQQADPTQSLRYLLGASDDFEEVGSEEVRGVATTHYRGTVDLRKVAELAPEEVRTTYERVIALAGVTELPFEVWVDEEGLARRMKYEQPLPSGSGGQKSTMALTMEMYDFGVQVDVEPPPSDQVIDMQKLLGG